MVEAEADEASKENSDSMHNTACCGAGMTTSAFSFHRRRIDGRLGAVWRRGGRANPGQDRLVGGVLGTVPARAADVGEACRAGWVGTALALGTSRLAEEQARFGLAQVHDLEHRVVVDQELLVRAALGWIGLGDPENRVVGVTASTGIRVFPRLVEERVDRVAGRLQG